MVRLQAPEVMWVFSLPLYCVDNMEVLADLLEWMILEAVVLLVVELQLEHGGIA